MQHAVDRLLLLLLQELLLHDLFFWLSMVPLQQLVGSRHGGAFHGLELSCVQLSMHVHVTGCSRNCMAPQLTAALACADAVLSQWTACPPSACCLQTNYNGFFTLFFQAEKLYCMHACCHHTSACCYASCIYHNTTACPAALSSFACHDISARCGSCRQPAAAAAEAIRHLVSNRSSTGESCCST